MTATNPGFYAATAVFIVLHLAMWVAFLLQLLIHRRSDRAVKAAAQNSTGPRLRLSREENSLNDVQSLPTVATMTSDPIPLLENPRGSQAPQIQRAASDRPPSSAPADNNNSSSTLPASTQRIASDRTHDAMLQVPARAPNRVRSFDEPPEDKSNNNNNNNSNNSSRSSNRVRSFDEPPSDTQQQSSPSPVRIRSFDEPSDTKRPGSARFRSFEEPPEESSPDPRPNQPPQSWRAPTSSSVRIRSFDEPDSSVAISVARPSTDELLKRAPSSGSFEIKVTEAADDDPDREPGAGDGRDLEMASMQKPSQKRKAEAGADSRVAPPRIGTLQRVLHPLGLLNQSLQLVLAIDPFGVFGIYSYRGPLILVNLINYVLVILCIFTAYDFLRLRYATILTEVPRWAKRLIISIVVLYGLEVIFAVVTRVILDRVYWVTFINYISQMIVEVTVLGVFVFNVFRLNLMISALDASFHRNRRSIIWAATDANVLRKLCCFWCCRQSQADQQQQQQQQQRGHRSSVSTSGNVDARTRTSQTSDDRPNSARADDANNNGANPTEAGLGTTLAASKPNKSLYRSHTTFSRVLSSMQRFAAVVTVATLLIVLFQLYVVINTIPKLRDTQPQNEPDKLGAAALADWPIMFLQFLIIVVMFYFTRLPIKYLWVEFRPGAAQMAQNSWLRSRRSSNTAQAE